MVTRNKRIRFCENNYAELISSSIAKSSELSTFPVTNAINRFRSRVYKPSGNFTIASGIEKLYINDGTDKTVSVTIASYATPELLAAEIQTQLNASSSNWTVSYSRTTFGFTIANSGSVSLRLSQTTDAIWSTIGFTGASDLTGTSFVADQQRNHTDEHVTFDLGFNSEITFFACIGELDTAFSISNNATVTLLASNLNQWDSPPLTVNLDVTDRGILEFIDDLSDTSYRFWRLLIVDKDNPDGPNGISISHIYLGDYVTFDTRNVSRGLSTSTIDPSESFESESGVLHFDVKTKYTVLDGMTLSLMPKTDKDKFLKLFDKVGTTTPFYISIDPTIQITDDINELTKYVVFNGSPSVTHVIGEVFSIGFSLRELV